MIPRLIYLWNCLFAYSLCANFGFWSQLDNSYMLQRIQWVLSITHLNIAFWNNCSLLTAKFMSLFYLIKFSFLYFSFLCIPYNFLFNHPKFEVCKTAVQGLIFHQSCWCALTHNRLWVSTAVSAFPKYCWSNNTMDHTNQATKWRIWYLSFSNSFGTDCKLGSSTTNWRSLQINEK